MINDLLRFTSRDLQEALGQPQQYVSWFLHMLRRMKIAKKKGFKHQTRFGRRKTRPSQVWEIPRSFVITLPDPPRGLEE